MFNSPEQVMIFVFTIAATILATNLWNSNQVENKKTEQLGKVGQQQK